MSIPRLVNAVHITASVFIKRQRERAPSRLRVLAEKLAPHEPLNKPYVIHV
jgi:hypothetical protein